MHTYPPDAAARLFDRHPLTRDAVLRPIQADRARISIQRNIGWRAARAPRIAFTDDDCRPLPDWLERMLCASAAQPGAIVQGATVPDPRETHLFSHTHFRTLKVEPPNEILETANVLYERELLEGVGGFDECAIVGEDIDLGIRARDAGGSASGGFGASPSTCAPPPPCSRCSALGVTAG